MQKTRKKQKLEMKNKIKLLKGKEIQSCFSRMSEKVKKIRKKSELEYPKFSYISVWWRRLKVNIKIIWLDEISTFCTYASPSITLKLFLKNILEINNEFLFQKSDLKKKILDFIKSN